jgi:hypothetical protein
MFRGAACFALCGLLLAGSAWSLSRPQETPPEQSFEGEIDVSLATMVIRVVDSWGQPILGLKPEDLRIRVGKREIPVVALDWVSAEDVQVVRRQQPEEDPTELRLEPIPAPGRLVVIFVQADLHPTRISGQLRLRRYTRELLATLHPQDRVAVVSFDSHLKLWQDFVQDDADAIHEAIDQAMLYSPAPEISPRGAVSLARHFDFAAARDAATPERALELMARGRCRARRRSSSSAGESAASARRACG